MPDELSTNLKTELFTVTAPASANLAVSVHENSIGKHISQFHMQFEHSRHLMVPVYYPRSQMRSWDKFHLLFIKFIMAVISSASVELLLSLGNQVVFGVVDAILYNYILG